MEQKNKIGLGEKIKNNLQKIVIIIVSVLYVIQGFFSISKKDATILSILGSIGISIIIGVTISSAFDSWGIKEGINSQKFLMSCETYGKAKLEATPNLDKLSAWCDYKNDKELENKKKEIIQSHGMKWKAYKLGYYDKYKDKLNDEQLKDLIKANNLKIKRIKSDDLLNISINNKTNNYGKFGKSIEQYEQSNLITDIITRFFLGILLGLYGLSPLITKDNAGEILANMLWNTMQIALWIAFGIIKFSKSKSFIEDEYRQRNVILKTEYLNEFIITLKNNPKIIDEYDIDNDDIDKYIDELIKEREKNAEQKVLD